MSTSSRLVIFAISIFDRLRRRTPGPSPFSSMNTTPAASKARRTAKSFGAVIDVSSCASSARRIVATPTANARARSSARNRIFKCGVHFRDFPTRTPGWVPFVNSTPAVSTPDWRGARRKRTQFPSESLGRPETSSGPHRFFFIIRTPIPPDSSSSVN